MAQEREFPSFTPSVVVGSAPFSSKHFTVSATPPRQAQCKGVCCTYKVEIARYRYNHLKIP